MTEKHSYGQILKSSALIGGSSLINIAIGVIRTKSMAILLGPSGVGLMGLYGSIIDLTVTLTGMGINSSGVRQIAEATGSSEKDRLAVTVKVLRRISFYLGLLGAIVLLISSPFVSALTFGNEQHTLAISLLSAVIFFNTVSAGQSALIQGMRRISDLAKIAILGTFYGTIISIIVVYFLREKGVAIALVLISVITVLTSWWYSRKITIQLPSLSIRQLWRETAALLKLGFAFMVSGLLMTASAYLIRLIVVRKVGFDAAGLYQAAWTLGGLYLGFILQAMGSDFYPRLTAVAKDNFECNRLVNEQAHISLLLAGPGVIATLTLAPLVIAIFYTAKFLGAVEILRWLCLGMALRVISWPLGFIIMAKGAQNYIIFSEVAWAAVYLAIAWFCVSLYGLNGVGIAFFASYVFHVFLNYVIARKLSDFHWTVTNLQTCFLFVALITIVFTCFYLVPFWIAIGIGAIATLISSVYSLKALLRLVSLNKLPRPLLKLLQLFRIASSNTDESQRFQDISDSPHSVSGLNKKSLTNLKFQTIALSLCIAFVIWANWYVKLYGWPLGEISVVDKLDNFQKKLTEITLYLLQILGHP